MVGILSKSLDAEHNQGSSQAVVSDIIKPSIQNYKSPIVGSLAVLQHFNFLTDTHLIPQIETMNIGPTKAFGHLKQLQSIDGFTVMVLMHGAEIDSSTGQFTDGEEVFNGLEVTRSWLADRLMENTNQKGRPKISSAGGKYQKSAKKVVDAAIAFKLVTELPNAPTFRSNNKPLMATQRLSALMEVVGEWSSDHADCFTMTDLTAVFPIKGGSHGS